MNLQTDTFKISPYMLAAILTLFDTTTGILFVPLAVTGVAGHDGWMVPLILIIPGTYIVYLSVWLGMQYPSKTMTEYLPLVLGKIPGKLVGFAYILFFIVVVGTVLREAQALLYGTGIFRQTPNMIVGLLIIAATTYAVSAGFEAVCRSIWYFWVFIFISYTLFLLGIIPFMKLNTLFPLGEAGFKTLLKAALTPNAYRGELVLLAFLFPYMNSRRDAIIGGLSAVGLITFLITLTVIATTTILGTDTAARAYYSAFFLADHVPATGLKIVLVIIWIISFWGKIALGQWLLSTALTHLCGFKDYRPFVLPMGILLLISSQVFFKDTTDLFTGVQTFFPGLALVFEYFIPTLLIPVIWLRKRRKPQTG